MTEARITLFSLKSSSNESTESLSMKTEADLLDPGRVQTKVGWLVLDFAALYLGNGERYSLGYN